MTFNYKKWILILGVAVLISLGLNGFLSCQLIQSRSDNKALEASHKILEADIVQQQEQIRIQFDSVEQAILHNNKFISDLHFDIAELDRTKADINKKSNENKNHILGVTNSDSLSGIISRRYR